MENNQSTQQSSELNASELARSKHKEIAQTTGWKFLLALIKHYPWLIWTGMWAFLIALAALAVFSLTHTGHVEQQESTPKHTTVEQPTAKSSQTSAPLPLLLLSAVALTLVAGSVMIAKQLNRSSQPRQLLQPQPASAPAPTRRRQRRRRLEASRPVPTPEPESSAAREAVLSQTEPTEPVVIPLPQEQPINSSSESLAEMMDIRKTRSLASILRDG